jgi:hypothetical protein
MSDLKLEKGIYFIDVVATDSDLSGPPEPLCFWTVTLWPDPGRGFGGFDPIKPTDAGIDCVVHSTTGVLTCSTPSSHP